MTAWTLVAEQVSHTIGYLRFARTAAIVGAVGAVMSAGSADADVLLSQPWDGSSNLIASYEDAYAGFHIIPIVGANVYDKFSVSTMTGLTEISFQGGSLNPSPDPSDEGFAFYFYRDNAGAPGDPYNGIVAETTNLGATLVGVPDGTPIYSYTYNADPYSATFAPGVYWLSIVRELDPPGQWGWATSAAEGNDAYQTVGGDWPPSPASGVTSPLSFSMAVEIRGVTLIPAPEPGTWGLMLIGLGVVGAFGRRARSRAGTSAASMV
jgi:hypothetical protein